MLKVVKTWYCDACGREIKGYSAGIDFIEIDDHGDMRSRGREFCKPCTLSFVKWMDSRKEWGKNHENDEDE